MLIVALYAGATFASPATINHAGNERLRLRRCNAGKQAMICLMRISAKAFDAAKTLIVSGHDFSGSNQRELNSLDEQVRIFFTAEIIFFILLLFEEPQFNRMPISFYSEKKTSTYFVAVSTFTQIVVNELRIQLIKNVEFIVLVFDYVVLGVRLKSWRTTEFNQVKQWEFALLAVAAMGMR